MTQRGCRGWDLLLLLLLGRHLWFRHQGFLLLCCLNLFTFAATVSFAAASLFGLDCWRPSLLFCSRTTTSSSSSCCATQIWNNYRRFNLQPIVIAIVIVKAIGMLGTERSLESLFHIKPPVLVVVVVVVVDIRM